MGLRQLPRVENEKEMPPSFHLKRKRQTFRKKTTRQYWKALLPGPVLSKA